MAAIGFIRCKEVHADSGQRCLKGDGHGGKAAVYVNHQGETVSWSAPRK